MAADFIRRRFSGPLHYAVKTGRGKRDPRLSGGFDIANEPVADVSDFFITGTEPKKGPMGTIQNRFIMGIKEENKPDSFVRAETFYDKDGENISTRTFSFNREGPRKGDGAIIKGFTRGRQR